MLGQIAAQRVGAACVAVMNDEHRDAQIHQGKGNSVPGAAGADLHDGRALRARRGRDVSSKLRRQPRRSKL